MERELSWRKRNPAGKTKNEFLHMCFYKNCIIQYTLLRNRTLKHRVDLNRRKAEIKERRHELANRMGEAFYQDNARFHTLLISPHICHSMTGMPSYTRTTHFTLQLPSITYFRSPKKPLNWGKKT